MSTITKERIELFIKNPLENGLTRSEQMEVARIALASLEADPIGEVSEKRYGLIMDGTVDLGGKSTYRIIKGEKAMKLFPLGTKFYTAPPAPVSVPDGVLKNLLPDAEKPEFWFEHNGTIFFEGVKFNNAVFDACRAAMLQGAEPVTTAYKLPDDFDFDRFNDVVWLETVASNPHMHSPTTSTIAMVALELNRKLAAGNSPVIPDGWVVVPVEPTEDMIVNGFESEPDESFSDEKEWEAYDAMSGCQQAAHRAKLCWAAMISAAPKPDAR